jgi:hypothetical protein
MIVSVQKISRKLSMCVGLEYKLPDPRFMFGAAGVVKASDHRVMVRENKYLDRKDRQAFYVCWAGVQINLFTPNVRHSWDL